MTTTSAREALTIDGNAYYMSADWRMYYDRPGGGQILLGTDEAARLLRKAMNGPQAPLAHKWMALLERPLPREATDTDKTTWRKK